jgi:hypothetical protein
LKKGLSVKNEIEIHPTHFHLNWPKPPAFFYLVKDPTRMVKATCVYLKNKTKTTCFYSKWPNAKPPGFYLKWLKPPAFIKNGQGHLLFIKMAKATHLLLI